MSFPGILIDHETPDPEAPKPGSELYGLYDKIREESIELLNKWTHPAMPLQEAYPIPTYTINGKK